MKSLDRNIAMTRSEGRGIVSAEANTAIPLKGDFERMARRRFQKGQLLKKGEKKKVWVGRWREDTIKPDGTRCRHRKSEVLGSLKEYPTRRLAQRALEQRISEAKVNSLDYRPSPIAKFSDFANKWDEAVLSQHKPSTQSADRSRTRKHLVPDLGETLMKDLTAQRLPELPLDEAQSIGPKSVKNLVTLLRTMWIQAKAWGYVQHDPFGSLVLPELPLLDERAFTLQEMKAIVCGERSHTKLSTGSARSWEIGAVKLWP